MTPEERAEKVLSAHIFEGGMFEREEAELAVAQALREHGNEKLERAADAAANYQLPFAAFGEDRGPFYAKAIRALKDKPTKETAS